MRHHTQLFSLALVVGLVLGALGAPTSAPAQQTPVGPDPVEVEAILDDMAVEPLHDVPSASCRSGFLQIGSTLCIHTTLQNADHFANVAFYCRLQKARVASSGDLYYLYFTVPGLRAAYSPNGKWIGPDLVGDNQVLCGNRDVTTDPDNDVFDFEGTCNKLDIRTYWCAHDLQ